MAKKGGKAKVNDLPDLNEVEKRLKEEDIEALLAWVDSIPLSRQKKNFARDFSDGVLVAEIVHHFFPKMVEMHNFTAGSGTKNKAANWYRLNTAVFDKMNFKLSDEIIDAVVNCKEEVVQKVLLMLQVKINMAQYAQTKQKKQNDKPEADQHSMTSGRNAKEYTKGSQYMQPQRMEQNPQRRMKASSIQGDMVPRIILEEREQELLAKNETCEIMQAKINRLEHLLHLKDLRIDDLQTRLEFQRPTGVRR